MHNFSDFVTVMKDIINPMVLTIVAASVVVFLYGVMRYIWSAGDTASKSDGRTLILWGIVVFVVMTGIWSIVNLLSVSFFEVGSYTPPSDSAYTAGTVSGAPVIQPTNMQTKSDTVGGVPYTYSSNIGQWLSSWGL